MWKRRNHGTMPGDPRTIACLRAWLAICLLVGLAGPASAEMVLHAGDAQADESASGYFDVFFEVHGGPYDLRVYMLELSVSDPGGNVTLTHLGEPENALFPGRTGNPTPGRPELPGPTVAVWDYFPTSVPLSDGAGLLRVYFETAPGSMGEYQVTIDSSLLRTNLSNNAGQLLSELTTVSFIAGQLDVVPEPSGAWLLAAAGCCLVLLGQRVRRRAGSTRA